MKKITSASQIDLYPNWKAFQNIAYQISREDYFTFHDSVRRPIKKSYKIVFNLLEERKKEIIIRAHFPNGFFNMLAAFQGYQIFDGKADFLNKEGGLFFDYAVHPNGRLTGIKNVFELKSYLNLLKKTSGRLPFEKEVQKSLKSHLKEFANDEAWLKRYLIKDIELIHEYYGDTFPINGYVDLSSDISEEDDINYNDLAKNEKEFLSNINSSAGRMEMIGFNSDSNRSFNIHFVGGIDLFSVDVRHDFSQIKKEIINGNFNIENYFDITLHEKKHQFDLDSKTLKSYSHFQRTISSKMEKIVKTRIELVVG